MGLFSFCKSAQYADAPKPLEQYSAAVDAPFPSSLTVPVNISIADLVAGLNNRLNGKALYEDFDYKDNGGDGLMMNAWKSRDITINLSGQTVKYYVPLKIWVKKNLYVGEAEVEGELALAFKTSFSLNPDWSIKTNTIVEYHEWLASPYLKTGLGNLNIESLANVALNRSKKELASTIDRIVSQQLNLRPYVQEVWSAIQQPTLLSEEYRMWVKTTPVSISITPINTDWNNIKAKIIIECLNDVSFGEKPLFRENTELPPLRVLADDAAPEEFQLRVAVDVPYPEAERMTKTMMVGQVMESGKKKVKVEDIQLWGNNDRLVVNAKLSGSFNGNIYFIAKPVFNPQKNQIEVQDLDFHVDTRNFLLKSASWLFSGPIKKRMKDNMTFPLTENVSAIRQEIQNTLNHYELQPGVTLSGKVDTLAVENTRLLPAGIQVTLFSKGSVTVDVKGL